MEELYTNIHDHNHLIKLMLNEKLMEENSLVTPMSVVNFLLNMRVQSTDTENLYETLYREDGAFLIFNKWTCDDHK